jgi:signal peptidase II
MAGPKYDPARSPWRAFAFTVIAVLVLDGLSKLLVTRALGPDSDRHSVRILSSLVELDYAENSGIAFGLLSDDSVVVWALVLLAAAGMAAIVWSALSSASPGIAIAMGLVAGGGLANLVDRFLDGHVVDFVSLWRWPSFNLADASITLGVATLLVLLLRQERATGY